MAESDAVAGHYGSSAGLFGRVLARLADAGLRPEDATEEMLSGVDEFHVGGRMATESVLGALGLGEGAHVIDLGCGVGGPARTMAARGHHVTGIDLTPGFVTAASELSELVGLGERTAFRHGDATTTGLPEDSFDAATVFHVGINVPDKEALFAEAARVVRPGGRLGVYDLMRTGDGDLTFPVPWAAEPAADHLAEPSTYEQAIGDAGWRLDLVEDWGSRVPELVARRSTAAPSRDLSGLVGEEFPVMFGNIVSAMGSGLLSPTLMVASRP